nr:hypothetical protein GCM10020241_11950 [Streptoalloteichus tenebrarius]
MTTAIADSHRHDAELIWSYQHMGHQLRPCTAAIGLGSYDLEVAVHAATLYHEGMFPVVVLTGATSAASAHRFPRVRLSRSGSGRWSWVFPKPPSSSNRTRPTPGRTSSCPEKSFRTPGSPWIPSC